MLWSFLNSNKFNGQQK